MRALMTSQLEKVRTYILDPETRQVVGSMRLVPGMAQHIVPGSRVPFPSDTAHSHVNVNSLRGFTSNSHQLSRCIHLIDTP